MLIKSTTRCNRAIGFHLDMVASVLAHQTCRHGLPGLVLEKRLTTSKDDILTGVGRYPLDDLIRVQFHYVVLFVEFLVIGQLVIFVLPWCVLPIPGVVRVAPTTM